MQKNDYMIKQPYIKVVREIGSVGKTSYKDQRNLYLYEDKLVTAYHEFSIEKVFDLSFKEIQGQGGILFVHTDHGVYSYTVEISPEPLIDVFKNIKSNN